jgi:hypothetical protein
LNRIEKDGTGGVLVWMDIHEKVLRVQKKGRRSVYFTSRCYMTRHDIDIDIDNTTVVSRVDTMLYASGLLPAIVY